MSPDAELMLIFGTLHLIAVALGVGPGRTLDGVRDRFSALARSLGAEDGPEGADRTPPEDVLGLATDRLRAAAARASGVRVLA